MRAFTALVLALVGGLAQSAEEGELERLLRAAREGSPVVRPQAAARLVGLGAAAAERLRAEAKASSAGYAVLGADLCEVLGELDDAELRKDLWALLADARFAFRPSVARTLAKSARAGEEQVLAGYLGDPLAAVRTAALSGLARVGACGELGRARALLADPDDRTRRAAVLFCDGCGDPLPLQQLVEELRREDRFFDQETGKAARYEALRILEARFGERFGYAPEGDPKEPGNRAAIARFAERAAALGGGRPYALPEAARAAGAFEGELLGLELRSCLRGELFLRWTARDELLVGQGNPRRVALEPGTSARLVESAAELLEGFAAAEFFGEPGCDLEAFHAPGRVLRVAKGPAPVPDLRPAGLSRFARLLVEALPEGESRLAEDLAAALGAVGGKF